MNTGAAKVRLFNNKLASKSAGGSRTVLPQLQRLAPLRRERSGNLPAKFVSFAARTQAQPFSRHHRREHRQGGDRRAGVEWTVSKLLKALVRRDDGRYGAHPW